MKKIDAEDALAKSADVVAANVDQLKVLFPEAVKEGKIDFDVLKQLLGGTVDDREERYGLNWHGKRRARQLALTPSTGTLRPCPEESVEWDTTQNLMIEGDNLEVLKLLQKSYAGKVKLIYIDPPYNTGRDFVYPDDFRDPIRNYKELTGQLEAGRAVSSNSEASGRFHTDWLNMMYPRLKIARECLRTDGLIFASVDDNELLSMRALMDEIFGAENFLDTIVWKKRYGGGAKEKHLVTIHDYIVVYAKSLSDVADIYVPLSDEAVDRYYTLKDEHYEKKGPFRTHPLESMKSFEERVNLKFPIKAPDGTMVMPKRQWRWSRERVADAQADGSLYFSRDREGNWSVSSKQYLKDDGEQRETKFFTIIDDVYSQHATNEIVSIFGDARIFPFPKPTRLIQKLLDLGTSNGDADIVLDFFAGSGTTAHAVMAQNAAMGGNRKFILVQLPEKLEAESRDQGAAAAFCKGLKRPLTISELTKERLKRSREHIKRDFPLFSGDFGFRVFKLDTSNVRLWDPRRDDIAGTLDESVEHLKKDRTEQDILFELLLKLGLELTVPTEEKKIAGKTVYNIGAGTLMACLDTKIAAKDVEKLAHGIADWHKELAPAGETAVVFRDSAFADDVAKTNLTAILAQAREDRPMIVRSL